MSSNLPICRACLTGTANTHVIRSTPLQLLYQTLTKYELATGDGRPETVCHVCYYQMQKFCRFRDKSQKSEEIITQLFNNGIEISLETVTALNRVIQQQFRITPIETMSYVCPKREGTCVKEEPAEVRDEEEQITSAEVEANNTPVTNSNTVCRVCLAGGMRTHTIKNTPIHKIYDKLTNTKLVREGRPDSLCYICRWQLLKCRAYINKCIKSERILTELFRNGIQLSHDTISILNSRMKPTFIVSTVKLDSYYPNGEYSGVIVKKEEDDISDLMELDSKIEDAHSPTDTKENCQKQKLKINNNPDLICLECNFKADSGGQLERHLPLHDLNRSYPCNICFLRYNTASSLRTHKVVHKNNFKCGKCKATFTSMRKLKMHMITHTVKDVYECEICNQIFKNRAMKRHHIYKAHPENRYPCGMCNIIFSTEEWRTDHIFKLHTGEYPYYTCDICRKRFSEKALIRKHIMLVHMKLSNYKCDVCDLTFHRKQSIKQHLKIHVAVKQFKCNFCSKTSNSKYDMASHIKNHTGEKPYTCEICNKAIRDKYGLKVHLKTHIGIRYICNFCGKKYAMKFYLKEHIQTHMTEKKAYACSQCDKTYIFKASYATHMETHKKHPKIRPTSTCHICYKQVQDLKQHMRTHTGEKPYCCSKCGKTFASHGNLRAHLKYHSGAKPFTCDICDKHFARKDHLITHMRIHTGEKPYFCDICNRSFIQKCQEGIHRRIHTGEKVFKCDQCDKSFAEKRSLDCHKTDFHAKKLKYHICDLCNRTFTEKNDLTCHIKSHKCSKPFKCVCNKTCKQSFAKLTQFAEHMRTHNVDGMRDCLLCRISCTRLGIARHYKSVHAGFKPYACNICEEAFHLVVELNCHVNSTHKGDKPYQCDQCGTHFTRGGGLKRHIRRFHTK